MRRVNPSYIIRTWERSQFTTAGGSMENFKTVWAENAKGFEHCGNCFKAVLLNDADMWRPARQGMAWVREIETPANPIKGEAWVTEWPINQLLNY